MKYRTKETAKSVVVDVRCGGVPAADATLSGACPGAGAGADPALTPPTDHPSHFRPFAVTTTII